MTHNTTTGRLMAALAIAALVLVAGAAGTASADHNELNLSDGSVSTYVEIDNETYRYNATSTPRYSDDLTDRWSFDATPPENELDGPNGQLSDSANVSEVTGLGGGGYFMEGYGHFNVTSGAEFDEESWTLSMWVDWNTSLSPSVSGSDMITLATHGWQGGTDYDAKLAVPGDGAVNGDGDGDTDDLHLSVQDISGSSEITTHNVSALNNGDNLTHLAVQFNGSHIQLFANGSRIGSTAASYASQTSELLVGGSNVVDAPNRTIDEVRVYDDAINNSSVGELHSEGGEPAKIDYYFPDGGFTSPEFNISRASRIAVNVSELTGASLDLYVERNASGDWLVDNKTEGITDEGWVNMTADGYFSQERRVRGNWSADEDASGVIDRIIGGGGSSGGALFVIPVLLIGVSAEMAGLGVVLIAFVAVLAVWRWRD